MLGQNLFDGCNYADITRAATKVTRKLKSDTCLIGFWKPHDDVTATDEHSWRAISALQGMMA
jgi:hypothetical protein